jgi:ADP-heptose:LPS heptosyltransferase
MRRILVIKLGALGDVVMTMGPAEAIRRHHADAEITLLTTPPFAELARAAPWFDRVEVDERPKPWHPRRLRRLARFLASGFDRVYDLQTADRSSWYFRLARAPGGGRPEWSGIARFCSHPHRNPRRDFMHTIERQAEQLAHAGIAETPFPSLAWAVPLLAPLDLPERYALLVPGAAAHRPEKRWPAERFDDLAVRLAADGLTPVVIGTAVDRAAADTVLAACPEAVGLVGRTRLLDLPGLAGGARLAVGNDTGPMHVAAVVGTPCIVLFSGASDPALTAPRAPPGAPPVAVLRADDLRGVPIETVAAALAACDTGWR